jgi:hypothetical protein
MNILYSMVTLNQIVELNHIFIQYLYIHESQSYNNVVNQKSFREKIWATTTTLDNHHNPNGNFESAPSNNIRRDEEQEEEKTKGTTPPPQITNPSQTNKMSEFAAAGEASDAAPTGERPRMQLKPRSKAAGATGGFAATGKANPFGAARPREEILKAKGVDVAKIDAALEEKTRRLPRLSKVRFYFCLI